MRRRSLLATGWAAAAAQALPAPSPRPLTVGLPSLGPDAVGTVESQRGIVPDLLQALEQRAECPLHVLTKPRARASIEFVQGRLDLLASVVQLPQLDQAGRFLPYGYTEVALLAGPAAPASFVEVDELRTQRKLRVGLVRGIHHGPQLEPLLQQLALQGRVEWASHFENLAARLRAARFAAAAVPLPILHMLEERKLLDASVREIPVEGSHPRAIGLYLHHRHAGTALEQRIESSLAELVASGEVRRIYQRHLGAAMVQRLFRDARS